MSTSVALPGTFILASFPGETQQQNNWCWAATCASINNYFATASSQIQQCDVVGESFYTTYCCQEPDQYDLPWYLNTALEMVGHFGSEQDGPIDFSTIQQQIGGARQPVAVRIGLAGGGDHSVVICGYNEQNQALLVWDPNGIYVQTNMADWQQDLGDWLNTYFTH